MRKPLLSAIIFFGAFMITYVGSCYLIPGWRIKLAADATTYFLKSVQHMVFLKSILSFAIASILVSLPFLFVRRQKG